MPTSKISPNLLETLLAAPGDAFLSQLSVNESITFAHTVDGLVFPPTPNFVHSNGNGNLGEDIGDDEGNEPDIAELPRRAIVDPGGPFREHSDYRLIGSIGRGGTGIVYQAHQRAIHREVAIKVLRGHLRKDLAARQRFLTEARTIGGLDHPNVIALHELAADENGRLFYSMKRIDGSGWDERIDELKEYENVQTLLSVADAIRYAHSRQIIHRDIKPENVMLGRYGEVLLADWGMATRRDSQGHPLDLTGSIGGTPAYMPPELALGLNDRITPSTDVYLLGAILYRIVTGSPPHTGSTLIECVRAAADDLIQPTEIDSELVRIARHAMNTRPQDRYESVDAFIAAVRGERQQNQSNRLVNRAQRRIDGIEEELSFEAFAFIDSLLIEAIELWPDNESALTLRQQLQMMGAESASRRGDFDAALVLYESAGELESDAAQEIRHRRCRIIKQAKTVSHYSALFVRSPDAGLLLRMPEGRVVEANDMFGQLFGYEKSDVVGQTISDLQLWVCPQRRIDLIEHLERTEFIDDFPTQLYRRNGEVLDVVLAGRRVELEGETMLVATIRDVSARRAAELDLARSRTRLRNLQRLAGLATWAYDIRSDSIRWSEELFRMVGRDPQQGTPSRDEFYQMVHPDDRAGLRARVASSMQYGTSYETIIRQRMASGLYGSVLIRGEPLADESGEVFEIYGVSIPRSPQ